MPTPVSTLMALFATFHPAWTKPTAENMGILLRGAILAQGSRTVTNCLGTVWSCVNKHFTTYHRLLYHARYDLRQPAKILFDLMLQWVPLRKPLRLVVDESLVRRYGPYVHGIGMHRDAVRSSHSRTAVTPGQKWVVLAILVKLPFLKHDLALPLLCQLYEPRKQAKRNKTEKLRKKHHTVIQLTIRMLEQVVRWAPNREIQLVGDGAYATHALVDACTRFSIERTKKVTLASRFRMDAQVYAKAPKRRRKGQQGRPRQKGKRLPSPRKVAAKKSTQWTKATVPWYADTTKDIMFFSQTVLWYKCGYDLKSILYVVVRDPEGRKRDEVFMTTDVTLDPAALIGLYVSRWRLETTFQEVREHLGLETFCNRSAKSVRRSAAMLLGVYSLIVMWFAQCVRNPKSCKRSMPWYKKSCVTFSDMLFAARVDLQRDRVIDSSPQNPVEFLFSYPGKTPYAGQSSGCCKAD